MIKTSYLKVSPAALLRVFEGRSALIISVLRIKVMPFSLYHSGASLSPPLPTQTWNPGSLAVPEEYNMIRN